MLNAVDPAYSVSGFAIGMLVGLTGVGGGSLMTPLLVLLFGVHPGTAVGTDLLYAAVTKGVGTLVHGAHSAVDWRIVRRLATGSVPATALTILVLSRTGGIEGHTHLVSVSLGIALLLTAVSLLLRRQLLAAVARYGPTTPRHPLALTVLVGAVLGVLVSISSVGAGALGVTALILLYPGITTQRIVGSDIAHAVPLTLIAGVGHWCLGSVDFALLGSLLSGSIPGVIAGSLLATRVPEHVLRPVLALTLVLAGSRLVA